MGENFGNIERETGGNKTLSERLKQHPELKERFEMILDIIENTAGDVEKADEAERRAMEAVRQLGHEVLQGWAQRQQQKKADEYDAKPGVGRKGKKTLLAHALRSDRDRRADLSAGSRGSGGSSLPRVGSGAVPGLFALVATSDGGFRRG